MEVKKNYLAKSSRRDQKLDPKRLASIPKKAKNPRTSYKKPNGDVLDTPPDPLMESLSIHRPMNKGLVAGLGKNRPKKKGRDY